MQKRKQTAANGGGTAVELADIAGTLAAHGLIDVDQLVTLRALAAWLSRVRRARGLAGSPIAGLWKALLSGQGGSRRWDTPIIDPERRTAADNAWWRLVQIRNAFAAAGEVERLALCLRVAGGEGAPRAGELRELKAGLDRVAALLRQGRAVWRSTSGRGAAARL